MTTSAIEALIDQAEVYEPEGPQPLFRELPEAPEFPVDALGSTLSAAAHAIHDKTRAPMAMCAQSVLAATALLAQGHVDIVFPTGQSKPCSLDLLTIGESGERKTTCDSFAMQPIKDFERMRHAEYEQDYRRWKNQMDAWEKQRSQILTKKDYKTHEAKAQALETLGAPPVAPMEPILTCEEPTYPALCKTLETGWPSIGIYSGEGGEFIGGHSMQKENKLRTSAGLSKMWDGDAIKRVRVGDGNSVLYGRRISMNLMIQPVIAYKFLSDPLLIGQGFLSRWLVSYPVSTQGERFWREPSPESNIALTRYSNRMWDILELPLPLVPERPNELQPRAIPLFHEAKPIWVAFSNTVEKELGRDGELRAIAGFANKVAEDAIRLALVIAFFENPELTSLSGEALANGIRLAQYYLAEALRLFGLGRPNPTLKAAGGLLKWLQTKWPKKWSEPYISISDITHDGPNSIRDKETAEKLVRILEENGWLIPCDEPRKIREHMRQKVWRIVQDPSQNDR